MARIGKQISFADGEDQFQRFAAIAQSYGLDPSKFCQMIANGEINTFAPTAEQTSALLEGVTCLLSLNNLQAASQLSEWIRLSTGVDSTFWSKVVARDVVSDLYKLIQERSSFAVTSASGNVYNCHYGDFWTPSGGRPQLRVWIEGEIDSGEPEALRHNRTIRLDHITAVSRSTGEWRVHGLDSIPVQLQIQPGFRYTPHEGDELEQVDGKTIVIRKCWSVFWLLQDLGRYRGKVLVVSPEEIRDRAMNEAEQEVEAYRCLGQSPLLSKSHSDRIPSRP
jgi:hypothetical protein